LSKVKHIYAAQRKLCTDSLGWEWCPIESLQKTNRIKVHQNQTQKLGEAR